MAEIIIPGDDPKPVTSAEELKLRQDAANEQQTKIITDVTGNVIRVEPVPDTDYLVFTTDLGKTYTVERAEALKRVRAVFQNLCIETGSANPVEVEKSVELCHMTFQAALKSGRARGMSYNSKSIQDFERLLSKMSKEWKNRSDYINNRGTLKGSGRELPPDSIVPST